MEQQQHLLQLVEQRNKLFAELETINGDLTRTREVLLKTQGAIEYLQAIGVRLPEKETEEISEVLEQTSQTEG